MEPSPKPDVIRWSASAVDAVPDVVETHLLLPIRLFLELESTARLHHMTIGQMARVLIGRGVHRPGVSPPDESHACP